jgi:hypothetical protein
MRRRVEHLLQKMAAARVRITSSAPIPCRSSQAKKPRAATP